MKSLLLRTSIATLLFCVGAAALVLGAFLVLPQIALILWLNLFLWSIVVSHFYGSRPWLNWVLIACSACACGITIFGVSAIASQILQNGWSRTNFAGWIEWSWIYAAAALPLSIPTIAWITLPERHRKLAKTYAPPTPRGFEVLPTPQPEPNAPPPPPPLADP